MIYKDSDIHLCIDEQNNFIEYEINGFYLNKDKFIDYLICAIDDEGELVLKQNRTSSEGVDEVIYTASLGGRKCEPMSSFTIAHLIDFNISVSGHVVFEDLSKLLN